MVSGEYNQYGGRSDNIDPDAWCDLCPYHWLEQRTKVGTPADLCSDDQARQMAAETVKKSRVDNRRCSDCGAVRAFSARPNPGRWF